MASPTELRDAELARRAASCRKAQSRQLVARASASDLGYASVDILRNVDAASLYELYVLPSARGQGVGKRLLAWCEDIAKVEGLGRIRLKPHALDAGTDIERLKAWYRGAGFALAPDETGEWEKVLRGLFA